jgi:hypothetical protein
VRLFEGIETAHLRLLDVDRFESGSAVHVYGPR